MDTESPYKPKALKRELNPIIGILEDPESEGKSIAQVADEIITALDEVRSKQNQVCIVARTSLDDGQTWQFFVMGPYKSMSVAKAKGESLATAFMNYTVKWLRFAMVNDHRAFLKDLQPPEKMSAWVGEVPVSRIRSTTWIEPEDAGGSSREEL